MAERMRLVDVSVPLTLSRVTPGNSDEVLLVLMMIMIHRWIWLKLCALKKLRVVTRSTVVPALESYRVCRVAASQEVFERGEGGSGRQIQGRLQVGRAGRQYVANLSRLAMI